MNGNEKLPGDHFWDSPEAEREYYRIECGLIEARKRLEQAHRRLLTVHAVFARFGAASGIEYSRPTKEEAVLTDLNRGLNPYWLPVSEKGRYETCSSLLQYPTPWQGSLVVRKVENEPVTGEVWFGRHKKRTGAYVQLRITYAYDKRAVWYAPTNGTVGMSSLEHALRNSAYPVPSPNSLYDKLFGEILQEVHALIAPLSRQVVLKFIPDLMPTNLEEIHFSNGIYKEDVPGLSWPLLTRYNAPAIGERYGHNSYKGIDKWPCCGRWELYQFPVETLRQVRERIERIANRLRERIAAAAGEVITCEEAIMLLDRRKDAVRILHYKPLVYRVFWSTMQTTQRQDFD